MFTSSLLPVRWRFSSPGLVAPARGRSCATPTAESAMFGAPCQPIRMRWRIGRIIRQFTRICPLVTSGSGAGSIQIPLAWPKIRSFSQRRLPAGGCGGKPFGSAIGWCDPKNISDCIPTVLSEPGGRGVSNQRLDRPDLLQWFRQLKERLKAVIVLNRPWQSGLTKTMLWQTPSSPAGASIGVLLDPPYLDSGKMYSGSDAKEVDRTANEAYEWALENGDRFRIVYCCLSGDFAVPHGWSSFTQSLKIKKQDRLAKNRDMIMCSPACCPDQLELFS